MPDFLAAKDLLEFSERIRIARKKEKPVVLGLGTHTIKVGLNPVIIDLMERGWISALCMNGSFLIHDFEIALVGQTSEDVSENLHKGNFGNTEETGLFLNIALKEGLEKNFGAGEAVGHYLIQAKFPFNQYSVLYNAYKLNIPVTVHPAVGTDFTHCHPSFDGSVVGKLAEKDSYVRKKKAEANLMVQLAEAEKVRLKNDALRGLGAERMVGLKMADAFKGLELVVLPSDGPAGVNPLDLDNALKLFDVRKGGAQ